MHLKTFLGKFENIKTKLKLQLGKVVKTKENQI